MLEKLWALTQCFPGNLKLMTFTLLEIENKLSGSEETQESMHLGHLSNSSSKGKTT